MTNFEKTTKDIETKMDNFKNDSWLHLNRGNKLAGQRARKISIDLEKLMKQWRALSTGREPVTE